MNPSEKIRSFLYRNPVSLLLISSGKDSAACLKMLREHLEEVIIVWCDTGNAFPEVEEYMRKIARTVPRFVKLKGRQKDFIKHVGRPSDLVFPETPSFEKKEEFVPWTQCCGANIWEPIAIYIKESGATGIITGQKDFDLRQGPAREGKMGNLEILHPLKDMTHEEVFAYLGDDVPVWYKEGATASLDCMNCTAHLRENIGQFRYLEKRYPETFAEVSSALHRMREKAIPLVEVLNGY